MAILHAIGRAEAVVPPFRYIEERHISTRLIHRQNKCASDYSACPASFGNGCCASGYECITGGCRSVMIACGRTGYFDCGLDMPGQCCPTGYNCARNGCEPPASSLTVTSVFTEHNGGSAQTLVITTVTTATNQPAATATTSFVTVVAMPTTVGSADDSSLAPKYIGAIVAGVVGFILVIAFAFWIIKRQLSKVMRAVDQRLDKAGHGEHAATVGDKVVMPEDTTQAIPAHHELHSHPLSSEILSSPSLGKPNPSHRWEMRGSYDAHGTSELDADESTSRVGECSKHAGPSS